MLVERLSRALGAKGGQYSVEPKLRVSGSIENFVGSIVVPTCDDSLQASFHDSCHPLEDG